MQISVVLGSLNLAVAVLLTLDPKAEPGTGTLAGAVDTVPSRAGVRIREKPRHVAGVITAVANTSFEILASPRLKERMRVRFESGTDFVDSDRGDLEPGRRADIIGVRLGNGDFLAARVVIREIGCPVSMPDGAILYHARTGKVNDVKVVVPSPCSSGAGSL